MLRIFVCFSFLTLFSITSLAGEPKQGPLYSIEVNEFLRLPKDFQVIYVAGAIDGMTFVSYRYGIEGHDGLVNCYSSFPLGTFTSKVVEMAKSKKDFKENVATLVAMTAENLCKKQGNAGRKTTSMKGLT